MEFVCWSAHKSEVTDLKVGMLDPCLRIMSLDHPFHRRFVARYNTPVHAFHCILYSFDIDKLFHLNDVKLWYLAVMLERQSAQQGSSRNVTGEYFHRHPVDTSHVGISEADAFKRRLIKDTGNTFPHSRPISWR